MPKITPYAITITDPDGITKRREEFAVARTMPHNTNVTLLSMTIHPTEVCDLLIVGHISISQSGTLAREARIDVTVRLGDTVIGHGAAVSGSPIRRWYDDRFGQWIEAPYGTRQTAGILASATNVPAGARTLTFIGRGWSNNGAATVRSEGMSVSVVEFYR